MSKFKEIFDARRTGVPELPRTQPAELPKRRGRPPAMRSDPEFLQVTAYIRKDTHRRVKIALLEAGQGTSFSELVEQLLQGWLAARG